MAVSPKDVRKLTDEDKAELKNLVSRIDQHLIHREYESGIGFREHITPRLREEITKLYKDAGWGEVSWQNGHQRDEETVFLFINERRDEKH